MTTLPLQFDDVLDSFGFPGGILVIDRNGSYAEDGTWSYTTSTSRRIDGIVLTAKKPNLNFLPQGHVSKGDIIVHTQATLYFTDPMITTSSSIQSFVVWQGYEFRLKDIGFQSPNANFNTYSLTRYQAHGSDA
mgnify:CR=1 FL=1